MYKKISIGIIGGGIAGLSFANFLYNNNLFKIKIFEKKDLLKQNMSGIQISNNAFSILKTINFNKILKDKVSIINNIQIQDYKTKKLITNFSLKLLNNNCEYICLDRKVLISFLLDQIVTKVEISNKEAISIKDNSIIFSDNSYEVFDYIVVADGIFSKVRKELQKDSFLKFSDTVGFKGIIRNFNKNNTGNLELYLGNKKHFIFYPINSNGDFSFTSIFSLPSSVLNQDYENLVRDKNNLINLLSDANDYIKNAIILATDIYQWPIYRHSSIFFGENKSFVIGDAAHGMVPFQAQGAAQSIEDAFCLASLFEKNIYQINKFRKLRLGRVSMINKRSNFNLYIYHMSNQLLIKLRNMLFKIIFGNKLICNLYFGKIYNFKFKNLI